MNLTRQREHKAENQLQNLDFNILLIEIKQPFWPAFR